MSVERIKQKGVLLIVMAAIIGISTRSEARDEVVSAFYAMSDQSFGVQAIAPANMVRELAICKAVWFAEKKHVATISLSNPVYGGTKRIGPASLIMKIPDDWVVLDTTAYLNAPNPDRNPAVSIAEKAADCRQAWDWYR